MELCTLKAIYLPLLASTRIPQISTSRSHLISKPSIRIRQISITRTPSLLYRPIYLSSLLPRATTSEETPGAGEPSLYIDEKQDEKRDGATITGDVTTTDNNAFNETLASEETKQPFDFLDNLTRKFGTEDTSSILLYGGGAIAALWLTSIVVSAIDSIPLFPKFLEVVGLAYTLWFTSRYLLFKQNRDELAAEIQELKAQVLGSDGDE